MRRRALTLSFLTMLVALVACSESTKPQPVVMMLVSPPSGSVAVGATLQLKAYPRGADFATLDRPVSFTSSDAAKATVDATGLVKGVAPGIVTINVKSEELTIPVPITVTASAPPTSQ
jgi:uncharacterized protein YjdB